MMGCKSTSRSASSGVRPSFRSHFSRELSSVTRRPLDPCRILSVYSFRARMVAPTGTLRARRGYGFQHVPSYRSNSPNPHPASAGCRVDQRPAPPTGLVSQHAPRPSWLPSPLRTSRVAHLYVNMWLKHTGRTGEDTTQLRRISLARSSVSKHLGDRLDEPRCSTAFASTDAGGFCGP